MQRRERRRDREGKGGERRKDMSRREDSVCGEGKGKGTMMVRETRAGRKVKSMIVCVKEKEEGEESPRKKMTAEMQVEVMLSSGMEAELR